MIAQNDRMVAINAALEIDLTGQVCAESIGQKFYSGFGGQLDFIRGAARAKGGKPVITMPSTAKHGTMSRIVPMLNPGAGVLTTRADVHYVATEFGIVDLFGKSVRQRAELLISIAHPSFRERCSNIVCGRVGFSAMRPGAMKQKDRRPKPPLQVCLYRQNSKLAAAPPVQVSMLVTTGSATKPMPVLPAMSCASARAD